MRDLLPAFARRWYRRWWGSERLRRFDSFLREVDGVVHVGANAGQERDLYHRLGLRVCWIEADPETHARLQERIAGLPDQVALNALVGDEDQTEKTFHVSNNEGLSSSVYEPTGHRSAWPEVEFVSQRQLTQRRLDALLEDLPFELGRRRALVLDVQGAELNVLRGAGDLLRDFTWIRLPAPDFEAYRGAPSAKDIIGFLAEAGFTLDGRLRTGSFRGLGSTFELRFRPNQPTP